MASRAPSPDPSSRSARLRRAARAGHDGDVDAARILLSDTDGDVRAAALGALARLGELSPADLVDALSHPDRSLRRRALELSAGALLDDVDVWSAVLGALDDPDATVAEVAAFACGERGERRGSARPADLVTRLATMTTDHQDALCREGAVAALGAIGDPAGLPAVLAATHDKATVRRRAVIALAPFDGPDVDEALERGRQDRDWQVRQAAEDLSD